MKNSMKMLSLLVLGGLVMLSACKKKHNEPTPLSLTSLTAGSADLNGAIAPTGVDPAAPIIATFTTNVDASTATTSNITLTRDFDQTNIPITITTAANVVTITPTATLSNGALFVLAIGAGLKATDGLAFAPVTRSFTTSGSFTPDGQVSYWNFENNANDVVGTNDPASAGNVVDITYVDGRNTAAGKAASFNGTTSIIEIPNGDQIMNAEFTLAFWMDLDSGSLTTGGAPKEQFVMGVGTFQGMQFEVNNLESFVKWAQQYKRVNSGITDTSGRDVAYDGTKAVHGTGGDTAITVSKTQTPTSMKALIGHQWNHVVYSFSATTKVTSLYWNGDLIFQLDYNFNQNVQDAGAKKFFGVVGMALHDPGVPPGNPDYYDNTWAFGFWKSRVGTWPSWGDAGNNGLPYTSADAAHYKGLLDDIHLYHRALTADEVGLMYNSEK